MVSVVYHLVESASELLAWVNKGL